MPKHNTQNEWYNVRLNKDHSHADIYIYGIIGWDVSSQGLVNELEERGNLKTITVFINSVGGAIGQGLSILNALRRHPATVNTEIDGYALSIGSVIAQAGVERRMCDNALMMIHRAQGFAFGDAGTMEKEAEILQKHEAIIINEYARVMDILPDEIQFLLDDETWFTAEEALEFGLINKIIEPANLEEAENNISQNAWQKAFDVGFKHAPVDFLNRANHRLNINGGLSMPATQTGDPVVEAPKNEPEIIDNEALRQAAVTAENQRRKAINDAFKPVGGLQGDYNDLLETCLADPECTADHARKMILDEMGKRDTGPVGGSINLVVDERDKFIEGATNAILGKARVIKREKNNEFNGMRLTNIARECVVNMGVNVRGFDDMKIVGMAFSPERSNLITQSTSDFPVILENVMHKALLNAFETVADTWTRFCAIGQVSDFRAHNRYRTGSFGTLDSLLENGEFKNKSIPDGEKESITAATKGNIINLTREMIINDDLGAFVGVSSMLGRAAKLTIESDVYALLASNPLLSDGIVLFHASHGNLAGAGTVITVDDLDAGRIAMGKQMDISGNEFIVNTPDILLCSLDRGGNARVIVNAVFDPDTPNKLQKPNKVNGIVSDIVDSPRISGTPWYLFADPNMNPVIEVAFLNGVDEPFLDIQDSFGVDGTKYKVRLDYGVAAVGYRGAYQNPGA